MSTAAALLGADFFSGEVERVARGLIGCTLLYEGRGGVIVETESYAADDPACHAFNGRTERNRQLFAAPGTAYVYRSYGIHDLLNFVAEPDGTAAAVLIRALEPVHGIEEMCERRPGRSEGELCSGPGKLTRALGVTLEDNGRSLTAPPFEVLGPAVEVPDRDIVAGPRIGISRGTDLPWRFCLRSSPYVSRPRPEAYV